MVKKPFSATAFVVAVFLTLLPCPGVLAQEPGKVSTETKTDVPNSAKPEVASITLAMPFAVGKVYRYKSTVEIINDGIKITAELTRRETITAVKENGEVLAQLLDEGGKAVINGMENPLPEGKPIPMLMDRYSRLLLLSPGEAGSDFVTPPIRYILTLTDRIAFPRLPVKPGDSWTTEVRNPTRKSRTITIRSTYLGTEMRDGVSVWKVRQTLEAATEDAILEAEMTAYLDPTNGQLIQGEQTIKNVPTAAGMVTWKGKLVRL